MKRAVAIAVVAVAFSAAAAMPPGSESGQAASASSCERKWRVFSIGGFRRGSLFADTYQHIASESAASVWAGGFRQTATRIPRPLIGRWDGRRWREHVLPGRGLVRAIAVTSDPQARTWVLYGRDQAANILVRWNGQAFVSEPLPTRIDRPRFANLVSAPGGRLWLAYRSRLYRRDQTGWVTVTPPAPDQAFQFLTATERNLWSWSGPTVARWVGKWSSTPVDAGLTRAAVHDQILQLASGEELMAVTKESSGRPRDHGFARFDGSRWRRFTRIEPPLRGYMLSFAGVSPVDAWAAVWNPFGRRWETLHWDGQDWSAVPPAGQSKRRITGQRLTMAGRDLWSVGPDVARLGCF